MVIKKIECKSGTICICYNLKNSPYGLVIHAGGHGTRKIATIGGWTGGFCRFQKNHFGKD